MSLTTPPNLGHTNFVLQLASSQNAAALSNLMTETFLAAYGQVATAKQLERHITRNYGAEYIAQRIEEGDIEVWTLLNSDKQDAGYLQLGLRASPPALLDSSLAGSTLEGQRCYLRPEYIGSGAGDLLMGQAQKRAIELGVRLIHLSVYQHAPRAVRFYEKHGFKAAGEVQYYIDDAVFDDWLMVWVSPNFV